MLCYVFYTFYFLKCFLFCTTNLVNKVACVYKTSALSCTTVLDLDFVKCPRNCVMGGSTVIHDICSSSSSSSSLSEVHVIFCECFFLIFYGCLMLRPRLTEVRETFTRGGP